MLNAVQKQQPRFTEEQKRELVQVHPWMGTGRLPHAIMTPVSDLTDRLNFVPVTLSST